MARRRKLSAQTPSEPQPTPEILENKSNPPKSKSDTVTGSKGKRKRNDVSGGEEITTGKREVRIKGEGICSDVIVTAGKKSQVVKRVKKENKKEIVTKEEGEVEGVPEVKIVTTRRGAKANAKIAVVKQARTKKKTVARKKIQQDPSDKDEEDANDDTSTGPGYKLTTKSKTKKPRKPKPPMLPFAPRTPSLAYHVGAHVSMAKGVQNAIHNTLLIGGNALALFLKSQRKWTSPDFASSSVTQFKDLAAQNGYNRRHILPHGSYLINLAQKEPEKHKQAYDAFLDDLRRCEMLGAGLYNFHPGYTGKLQTRVEAVGRIAESLNRAHVETENVVTLLENMAGHGTPPAIGSTLEDLRDIIAEVNNKDRVGVCIDTCHAFAAGYDLRTHDTFSKFWEEFDRVVGVKYLKAMHLNDSKASLGARRDLHHHIGQGYLGLEAFRLVMNCELMKGIPLILETPMVDGGKSWAEEIKLLESLIGTKGDEDWVLEKANELQELGKEERERVGDVIKKREKKEKKQVELKWKREKKAKKEAGGEGEVKMKMGRKAKAKAKLDVEEGGEEVRNVEESGEEVKDVKESGEGMKIKKKRTFKTYVVMIEQDGEESDSELTELTEMTDGSEGEGCRH